MSDVRIADELRVDAPIDVVWRAIEDPAAHAQWHPFVSSIAGGHELHAVRSCTVLVGRRHGTTTERCVECDNGTRIVWAIEEDSTGFGRMVSDWRSGFRLAEQQGATRVIVESTFRPKNPLVRALLPIVRPRFHRAQRAILEGLREAASRTFAAS